MAANVISPTRLRYLSADHLEAPLACEHVDVWNREDKSIGALDGVILDTATHRLRYLVVDARRLFGHYRFLLPFFTARIDMEHHALRVDVDNAALADCEPFDPRAYTTFA
jgi:hypothetical protein